MVVGGDALQATRKHRALHDGDEESAGVLCKPFESIAFSMMVVRKAAAMLCRPLESIAFTEELTMSLRMSLGWTIAKDHDFAVLRKGSVHVQR